MRTPLKNSRLEVSQRIESRSHDKFIQPGRRLHRSTAPELPDTHAPSQHPSLSVEVSFPFLGLDLLCEAALARNDLHEPVTGPPRNWASSLFDMLRHSLLLRRSIGLAHASRLPSCRVTLEPGVTVAHLRVGVTSLTLVGRAPPAFVQTFEHRPTIGTGAAIARMPRRQTAVLVVATCLLSALSFAAAVSVQMREHKIATNNVYPLPRPPPPLR